MRPVRASKVSMDAQALGPERQVPWGLADPDLGLSSLDLEAA